jgi:hypothetical protein
MHHEKERFNMTGGFNLVHEFLGGLIYTFSLAHMFILFQV